MRFCIVKVLTFKFFLFMFKTDPTESNHRDVGRRVHEGHI